jgi:hypothetical protein
VRGRWTLLAVAVAGCQFDGSGAAPAFDPIDAAVEVPVPDAAPAPDAAPPPPPFCDPGDPDLVACYRFEATDHAAQPFDESQYGNQGTATEATFAAGVAGQAMVVGSASLVRVPDSASLDVAAAVTMEMWVAPRTLPTTRAGLLDNNAQYGLFLAPKGEVRCAIGKTVLTAAKLPVGTFSHIACTADGKAIALYQDGALVRSLVSAARPPVAGDSGLAIGQNSPDGDPLDGAIDQVRIWRVARTAAQICAAAGRTGC